MSSVLGGLGAEVVGAVDSWRCRLLCAPAMNSTPTRPAGAGGGCCSGRRRRCRCCRCCSNAGSSSAPSAAAVRTAAAAALLLVCLFGVCCGPLLFPAAAAESHSFGDAAFAAASLSLPTDLPPTAAAAKSVAAAAVTAATGGAVDVATAAAATEIPAALAADPEHGVGLLLPSSTLWQRCGGGGAGGVVKLCGGGGDGDGGGNGGATHTTGGAMESEDGSGEGRAGRTLLGIPTQATTAASAATSVAGVGATAVAGSGGPRYLLSLCVSGRLSNHEMCMHNQMAVASILNRTLIVPEWAVGNDPSVPGNTWRWDIAVDWARFNRCLARRQPAVVLLQDYLHIRALQSLNLSRLLCLKWRDDRTGCVHPSTWRLLKQLNGSLHLPVPTAAGDKKVTGAVSFIVDEAEVVRLYGRLEDEVLCVGEGFPFAFRPPYELPVVQDEPGCANMLRPVPAIMEFVKGLVETMLGDEYASVHMRRGDMYAHTQFMKRIRGLSAGTYLSTAGVAKQIKEHFADADVSVLFIASDGRKAELELLFALLGQPPRKTFAAIVSLRMILDRDEGLQQEGWAQGFFQLVKEGHGELALTLADKYLCSFARHFLGSKDSTFSKSIHAIRQLEGRRSPLDGTISL